MDLRRLVRQRSAAAQRLPSTCATLCASPLPPPLLACCVAARLSWSTLRDRTAGRSRPLQAAAGCCRFAAGCCRPQPAFPRTCRRSGYCACATPRQADGTAGPSSTTPTARAPSPPSGRRYRCRARVSTGSPSPSRASATRRGSVTTSTVEAVISKTMLAEGRAGHPRLEAPSSCLRTAAFPAAVQSYGRLDLAALSMQPRRTLISRYPGAGLLVQPRSLSEAQPETAASPRLPTHSRCAAGVRRDSRARAQRG